MPQPETRAGATEQTVHGLATYAEPTFRTYAPTWEVAPNGQRVLMRWCESYKDGRWVGFYLIGDTPYHKHGNAAHGTAGV